MTKFEFKIQFFNLLGKPSGFLGYRGNRESRAPLGFFFIPEPKPWLEGLASSIVLSGEIDALI
jgi:hypothetical protein